jgi:cell wall-associated NlpC family hydrolase
MSENGRTHRLKPATVRRLVAAAGLAGLGVTVPFAGGAAAAVPDTDTATTAVVTSAAPATTTAASTTSSAQPAATTSAARADYVVRAGDTLSRIATAHQVSGGWKTLYDANRDVLVKGPDYVEIGWKLRVDTLSGQTSAPAPATTAKPAASKPSTSASSSPSTVKPSSSAAATAIAFARSKIGVPYVYGGTGNGGYDCSGLVQAAYKAAGISLPRVTTDQFAAGPKVSTSNLQPGDLVFFYSGISHVGIYIGNGEIIHAPRPGKTVEITKVSYMPVAGATRPAAR